MDFNCEKLINLQVLDLIMQIYELKGRINLLIEQNSDILAMLSEISKINSVEAVSKIEDISISDDRIKLIAMDKAVIQSCDEQELAGYRDVLTTINESYEYIPLKFSMILQLHSDLYRNNVLWSENIDENNRVNSVPSYLWETAEDLDKLCKSYNDRGKKINPLLLIPAFIIDFLSIHPFDIGDERMSLLLMKLLLFRSNFIVGKYVSIEKIIEENKEMYFNSRYESSLNLADNTNDYEPFVRFILSVIIEAYREFENQIDVIITRGYSKPERIEEIIKQTKDEITKREIMEKCPDISDTTIQRTLNDLLKRDKIIKIGGGRYTKYIFNRELES